jgi:hypothetical protein
MKGIAWAAAVVTLFVSGIYTVVSLARWEWSRAVFFAIVFVSAEVLIGTAAVLARIAKLESDVALLRRPEPVAADALRATRGSGQRFAWMRTDDPGHVASGTNVFVTLLVGGGVLLSAGAWLIDKIATRTVDPRREAMLGRQLDAIAYRPGLVVDEVNALARPHLQRDEPQLDAFLDPRP